MFSQPESYRFLGFIDFPVALLAWSPSPQMVENKTKSKKASRRCVFYANEHL